MSPAKPVSNIHATALLICCALVGACDRAETQTTPVTTTAPAGSSTAPSAAAASGRDEALVRVVHAIPFGSAMDVYAGDLVVFDGVGFKSVSSYRALDGKRYAFALRPAGMTNAKPLASNTEGLEDGHYYSVFALPGDGRNVHLRIVRDDLGEALDGSAQLRVVNGGDGLDRVDIRASGSDKALVGDVPFQAVTQYAAVNPFSGTIEVRSGDKTVLMLPTAHIEAGRFYTMVIVGSTKGTPPLEAFIIEDRLGSATATR
jgi:hypothetical protein